MFLAILSTEFTFKSEKCYTLEILINYENTSQHSNPHSYETWLASNDFVR